MDEAGDQGQRAFCRTEGGDDAAGRRTAFAYDGLNRLVSVTESAGGSVAPANVTTTFAYATGAGCWSA